MMKVSRSRRTTFRAALCALMYRAVGGCAGENIVAPVMTFEFDFQNDMDGWRAVFADYPAGANPAEQAGIDAFYELGARHTTLPAPLDRTEGSCREGMATDQCPLLETLESKGTS